MPWAKTIKGKTTAQRGYGTQHQRLRRERVNTTNPSTPCGYCGQPLGPDRSTWALPHSVDRTHYLPGLWHSVCNNREAAIRGARTSNAKRRGFTNPRW